VRAGLERHIQSRLARIDAATAGIVDRRALGMRGAELGVKALADHLVALDENRADERIGADAAAASLGKLERALKVDAIAAGHCVGAWRISHGVTPD
jgi:hypothetical protein